MTVLVLSSHLRHASTRAARTVFVSVALLTLLLTSTVGGTAQAAPRANTWPPGDRVELATGLPLPWAVDELADGSVLLTGRDTAQVRRVTSAGATVVGTIPRVAPGGEGGLLGITHKPGDESTLFLYFTTSSGNEVATAHWDGNAITDVRTILSGMARASTHNGGRIAFGPDGFLYVGVGDAAVRERAQDRNSLNGKILRITTDGKAAPGNPFGTPVWSYGHRNVQGLAWDSQGRMYASEFGQDTWDELNRIEPGKNYGWPLAEGTSNDSRFTNPLVTWRPAEASPSGLAVIGDHAYVAGLRGQSVWDVPLAGGNPRRLVQDEFGRVRAVVPAADGRMYLLTNVGGGKDKLVLVNPAKLPSRITQHWTARGGAGGPIGAPTGGENCRLVAGGCVQGFAKEGTLIYWTRGTDARLVRGAIGERYGTLGWEHSRLGYPTTDENCGLVAGGCYNHFQGGSIYWSPGSGGQPVWGAIRDKWADSGWEHSKSGYPASPEYCGLRDGGCFQRYGFGSIYWSGPTGAHPVWGAIGEHWARNGWETGRYGFPVGDESCRNEPGKLVCTQDFRGGRITFDSARGTY